MPRTTAKLSGKMDENMEKLQEEAAHMPESDLKDLVLLGRLTDSLNISGYSFVISTLTAREQKNIMKHIMSMDEMDRILGAKTIAVAYCTQSINGVSLDVLAENFDGETRMDKRFEFMLDLQSTLTEKLYEKYEELVRRSGEEVGLDTLKK